METEPVLLALPGTVCSPAVFEPLAAELDGAAAVHPVSWLAEPGPWDIPAVAARAAAFIEGRWARALLVCGHSTGGAIALQLAVSHPGTVAGLLLVDTGAHMKGHGDVDAILGKIRTGWGEEAPAGQLIPAHNHHDTHEVFYVVDGKVRVFVAGRDGHQTARQLAAGDFGYIPAGLVHAYQVEEASQVLGVASGGFERFFQQMGQPTDHATADQPPFIPDFPRMQAAAQGHDMEFRPDFHWHC